MKIYLNSIQGIEDAIRTMYLSKRSWTREKDLRIRYLVESCTDRYGKPYEEVDEQIWEDFQKEFNKLVRWGKIHFTMLRFMDFSVTVDGLHRGATDDFDAHAKRLDNRIIRSSTRLATYTTEEISDWYKDKIVPTDVALAYLDIVTPDEITYENKVYVKSTNGYILKGMENSNDIKRGLYMMSLPMTFTFKINATEYAHIYKERGSKEGGANGGAAPELKLMIEELTDKIENWYPQLNRKLWLDILN